MWLHEKNSKHSQDIFANLYM